jgi:hypothetical protein
MMVPVSNQRAAGPTDTVSRLRVSSQHVHTESTAQGHELPSRFVAGPQCDPGREARMHCALNSAGSSRIRRPMDLAFVLDRPKSRRRCLARLVCMPCIARATASGRRPAVVDTGCAAPPTSQWALSRQVGARPKALLNSFQLAWPSSGERQPWHAPPRGQRLHGRRLRTPGPLFLRSTASTRIDAASAGQPTKRIAPLGPVHFLGGKLGAPAGACPWTSSACLERLHNA